MESDQVQSAPLHHGGLSRSQRMARLGQTLNDWGLYVGPVYRDGKKHELDYFIVAVDNPYDETRPGQAQG